LVPDKYPSIPFPTLNKPLISDCILVNSSQWIEMLATCQQSQRQGIQVKLSTIFKYKVSETPQSFGSFFESSGKRYCAVSVLSKYLGYDIATASKKSPDDKNMNPAELIPCDILDMIENYAIQSDPERHLCCFCSKPDYYCLSMISLLIHLNDYHKMTFTQIGSWLESEGV
jgi:hypothetical protein